MKHKIKKSSAILALIFLSSCGGLAFTDERYKAETASAEFAAFCAKRAENILWVNTAGYLADAFLPMDTLRYAVRRKAMAASDNPTTKIISARCAELETKGE